MKYFSIKCKTWNDACELFYEAAKLGWLYSHDNGLFGINSFDIYKGLMVFNVGTKRFVFEEKGVSYHFEYEKTKAFQLLNEIPFVTAHVRTETGYEFYLSNGKQIKYGEKILASHERRIENPTSQQLAIISYYREHIKPELDKKAKEVKSELKIEEFTLIKQTKSSGHEYPISEWKVKFSDGNTFNVQACKTFNSFNFFVLTATTRGDEYYKQIEDRLEKIYVESWITQKAIETKPLKITAAKKEVYKEKNGLPFFEVGVFNYSISFNDGHTINCVYRSQLKRKKLIPSKKFTITDKHLELIYDYIDKDNQISPFKFTGNEPYFSGSKQFYGKPDWLTGLVNAFKETQKEIDEKLKKQQPESHKIRMDNGGSICFRNEANPNAFLNNEEKVITNPPQIKQPGSKLNGLDLFQWRDEAEKYKSKYEKQKEKKKQAKQDLQNLRNDYNAYHQKAETEINNLSRIIGNNKVDAEYFMQTIKEVGRIFPQSKCSDILSWLKAKCPVTELGIEKITDSERIELKSLYELLNENIPEFVTSASFKDKMYCLKNYINESEQTKSKHDELSLQYSIVKSELENQNKSFASEVHQKIITKPESKPKLIVKTGLTYKGRRVSDNRWLNGILVKIKSVGEKGIVILENKKGRHEVIYRTLEQIK